MARPILKVKNIADAPKRYSRVAKDGAKAVRFEFGIPFALQNIIAAKPRAKGAIFGVLNDGDRFDGQKLVRLLKRINEKPTKKRPELKTAQIATAVEKAVR